MIRYSSISPRLGSVGPCLLLLMAWATQIQAQSLTGAKSQGCADNIIGEGAPGYQGHRIHSVKVNARYLSVSLPAPGTPYSPVTVSKIVEDVAQALRKERNREDVEGATEFKILNAVSVGRGEMEDKPSAAAVVKFSAVTSCVKVVEPETCKSALGDTNPNCVDITVSAISLRLDSTNLWSNFLPIPRSNEPTMFSEVPGPLLALNPKIGGDYDGEFGASQTLEISSNLLDLPRTLKSQPVKVSNTRLDLTALGRKSQNEVFYNSNMELSLSRSLSGLVESIAARTSFAADHLPLAEGNYLRNTFAAGASLRIRPGVGPLDSLMIGATYRRSSNRFSFRDGTESEMTPEKSFEGRIISNGHLGNGVTRLALWADIGSPNNGAGYNRLAGIFGYQKEIPVAPNQTVGVEAIVGAGRTRGDAPQYARFYGGNTQKDFLYEPDSSPVLTSFPVGPLLRSLGSGQGSAGASTLTPSGGTSYWHLNLNITIPIRAWSSPLVPNIEIDGIPKRGADGKVVLDADGNPVTESRPVKALLKSQGASSQRVLQKIFAKQGLSPEEAQTKAARELRGINSLLGFIADQANIFSVKPLLMFDAARIGAPGNLHNQTRYAIGGGLQLTIVVAKFEAGYMYGAKRISGDPPGNFVMRLVFQNLF
jgi:hypothetical protein